MHWVLEIALKMFKLSTIVSSGQNFLQFSLMIPGENVYSIVIHRQSSPGTGMSLTGNAHSLYRVMI